MSPRPTSHSRTWRKIERRAGSAYRELKEAHHFEYVIPNYDGEDSDNWEASYYPLGDARRAFLAVVALLAVECTSRSA